MTNEYNASGATIDDAVEVTEPVEQDISADPSEEVVEDPQEEQKDKPEEGTKPKKPSGWHRKIARLEREKAELLERVNQANNATAKTSTGERPRIDDFDTYDDYVDALTDYKVDQKLQAKASEEQKAKVEAVKRTEAEKWQDKIDALDETYDDYEDVIASITVAPKQVLIDAVKESEVGAKLAYHLGKNPELIEKLNAMNTTQAIRELAKIEDSFLTGNQNQPSKPSVTKTVSRPAPVTKPLKGTGGMSGKVDLSNIDDDFDKNIRKLDPNYSRQKAGIL